VLQEDTFLAFSPLDIIRKNIHLGFVAIRNGIEVVEKGTDCEKDKNKT